jgi:hypothetical protein
VRLNAMVCVAKGWLAMRATDFLKFTGLLFPLLACEASNGQESGRPIEGSTGGVYMPHPSSALSDLKPGIKMHLDPFGKPCVTVAAYSLAKTDYRKIFGAEQKLLASGEYEHMIAAKNHCSQMIRLKVCYFGSQSCVTVDVASYGDQRASLGISTGQGFRYQYTEQF